MEVHKRGDRDNHVSYTPVSLTSTMLKNLEMVIRDRIVNDLGANNLVTVKQHGCSHKRSRLTNLISFLDEVMDRVDGGEIVEV